MHVTIREDPSLDDICVAVDAPAIDERVTRIVGALKALDQRRLVAQLDGRTHLVAPDEVLYAESVDGRTFLYTHDQVFQTPMHLYELEERLAGTEFVRTSRQALVNFDHVRSLRPALGARMVMTLSNGEDVLVSRQYAGAIKKKLSL